MRTQHLPHRTRARQAVQHPERPSTADLRVPVPGRRVGLRYARPTILQRGSGNGCLAAQLTCRNSTAVDERGTGITSDLLQLLSWELANTRSHSTVLNRRS